MTENRWQRLGGACGVLYVAVVVAGFFTLTTPAADDPTGEIARLIADDRTGHIAGVYLGGIAVVLFVAFVAALAARARSVGASAALVAAGTAVAVGWLVSSAVTLALVQSAHEGREIAAVRALFELDEVTILPFGFAVAAFLAAAATVGALPRPLRWTAGVLGVLVAVGLLGLFSDDEEEGGVLGIAFTVGLLAHYLWALAAGGVMLRGRGG